MVHSYVLWVLLGMACYSLMTLFVKLAEQSGTASSYMVLAVATTIVPVFALAMVGVRGEFKALLFELEQPPLLWAIAAGLVLTVAVGSLFHALSLGPATVVGAGRQGRSRRGRGAGRHRRRPRLPGWRQGKDVLVYQVKLDEIAGEPAKVRAELYYQATPPYYLQDRFCTSRSEDTGRLYYMAGKLDLAASPIESWKLKIGKTAEAPVP